jgi:hypothetical protein
MTTGTGNRNWAYTEAKRRADIMKQGYAVYQRLHNNEEYIIRPKADEAPDFANWRHVATIEPGGGMTMYR